MCAKAVAIKVCLIVIADEALHLQLPFLDLYFGINYRTFLLNSYVQLPNAHAPFLICLVCSRHFLSHWSWLDYRAPTVKALTIPSQVGAIKITSNALCYIHACATKLIESWGCTLLLLTPTNAFLIVLTSWLFQIKMFAEAVTVILLIGLCSPSAAIHEPKQYVVNLDLPPEQRWLEVLKGEPDILDHLRKIYE